MDRLVPASAPAVSKGGCGFKEFTEHTHPEQSLLGYLCHESPSDRDFLHLHHIVSEVNDSQLHEVLFKITEQLVPKSKEVSAT